MKAESAKLETRAAGTQSSRAASVHDQSGSRDGQAQSSPRDCTRRGRSSNTWPDGKAKQAEPTRVQRGSTSRARRARRTYGTGRPALKGTSKAHGAARRAGPPASGLSTSTGPERTEGAATQGTAISPRLRPDGSGEGGERDRSDMARNLRSGSPDKAKSPPNGRERTDGATAKQSETNRPAASPWLRAVGSVAS